MDRRSFIKAAGAMVAAPAVVPASSIAAEVKPAVSVGPLTGQTREFVIGRRGAGWYVTEVYDGTEWLQLARGTL
jgi:hypothetical protein